MSAGKSKAQVFAARLFSTILLVAVVGGTMVSMNPWAFMALMSVLSIAASVELFRMIGNSDTRCQPRWGMTLSVLYTLTLAGILGSCGREGLAFVSQIDTAFIAFAILSTFMFQLREPVQANKSLLCVGTTVLSVLYIPFLFGFLGKTLFVPPSGDFTEGVALLIWLVVVTKITDIGAYCTGSLIGKHKMIPHISPGKTWQGFFGALVWALVTGSTIYYFNGENLAALGGWPHVITLCIILPLLTVVGDLAESVIKRSLDAKDSGNTLPGIGGALDLIDSLCFTAPALYFYLLWLN
ncbi:phosphatidate cytidylyltransferase [Rubritalea marina]|uniref:phosphatidate cytidylyltransferase n=1 Tax=Rubritalea marina TaxID=361055 RepID=UPI001969BF4C|nr:CDP-archaeol synthase [Rubritalea marina]